MSKLSKLQSKGRDIRLSEDYIIHIKPITLDDEITVGEFMKKEELQKALSFIVKQTIKRAEPDATDEEINNLDKEVLKTITEEVLDLNGFKMDEEEKNLESS